MLRKEAMRSLRPISFATRKGDAKGPFGVSGTCWAVTQS
jgi:hypothetical protein